MRLLSSGVAALVAAILLIPAIGLGGTFYYETSLTSDLPGFAPTLDTNLVNPWGIAFGPTSPIWIADNGTGLSTVYNGSGGALPIVVSIPAPGGGSAAPDGIVFNSTAAFGGAHFIFSTEDGTIASWTSGANAVTSYDNSGSGAVYKGIASDFYQSNDLLYATNFNAGTVDVYDSSFNPATVPGGFLDSGIPTGFAPFGIADIGGNLFVTYAKQDADKHDDVAGPGNGYVAEFTSDGTLVTNLISQGVLNSPWGLAVAPSNFGAYSGDLLVGNFGDGTINAFNLSNGNFLGTLSDSMGNPIVTQGLWGLAFGNGSFGTSTNTLYFTAGIPGHGNVEDHGLFGDVQVSPEPGTMALTGLCAAGLLLSVRNRRKSAKG